MRQGLAYLQPFSRYPTLNWCSRGNNVTERIFIIAGCNVVSPHPRHIVSSNGQFYTPSASSGDMSIHYIMDYVPMGDAWKSVKQKEETLKASIRAVFVNVIIRTQLKRHLSDSASYKKSVSRECLFSILKYDKLISKNTMKTDLEKEMKNIQISDMRLKLMKRIPRFVGCDMELWRRCEDGAQLFYGYLDDTSVPPV